jgi:hypothetical protein
VYSGLERVRERARTEKKERFTALLRRVDVGLLRAAYWLKRDAAPGVDGLTWREYEQSLEANLADLHARVHRGAYLDGRRATSLEESLEPAELKLSADEFCCGEMRFGAC